MTLQIFKNFPDQQLVFGVFDFDNGIVDTESVFAIFDCQLLNEALVKAGVEADLMPETVRPLAGNSGGDKLRIIAGQKGFDPEPFIEGFNVCRSELRKTLFRDHAAPKAAGLDVFLAHLGDRRVLATNKKAVKLFPDLEAMGLSDLFEIIVTSDDLNKKPAPDVIVKALEQLSAQPEESAYFGDNVLDIEAAVAAGVTAVGFIIEGLEGHEDRIEAMKQAGAHAVTDDYADMVPYFVGAAL